MNRRPQFPKPPHTQDAGDFRDPLFPKGAETLLVVDDEQVVLDVTCEMLGRLGYTVLRAGGGTEAMEVFASHRERIDAVVLDLTMPTMDGEECMSRLLDFDPNLRILVATARLVSVHESEWIRMGAWDAIQKPFLFEDLARRLRSVLDSPARGKSPRLASTLR